MPGINQHHHILSSSVSTLLILVFFTACAGSPQPAVTPSAIVPTAAPSYQAEVDFEVDIPANTPSGQFVYLDILDEVTGLGLNPQRYSMKPVNPTHFSIHLPVTIGSVIKYRYGRDNNPPAVEYSANGKQVRYRLAYITGPKTINDAVSGWNDLPYSGPTGRINGQIVDKKTNVPVPDVMVATAGMQTLTASDGTFLLEGIQPGIHNLVAYSLDGNYAPYQQEAQVTESSMTPAPISLDPAGTVKVTFIARPPEGTPQGIPVRLVGNILQLGNTFADLNGGLSVVASRAPLMTYLPDGSYFLTLDLSTGTDLRYKYTLGDGFWNSELNSEGQFRLREVIVPDHDITIDDQVVSWKTKDYSSVTFNVKVSAPMPASEVVSIQFNPYGWTEPLPMWPLGNGEWIYVLYNPLQLLDEVSYRFCRNDQCGVADEGSQSTGGKDRSFTPQFNPQKFQIDINQWVWWQPSSTPLTLAAPPIQPRQAGFIAGVELVPDYRPDWLPFFAATFQSIKDINANTAILTPTWTFTSQNPPVLEPVSGKDILWQDLIQIAPSARSLGLDLLVFPTVDLGANSNAWWASASKDVDWWQSWFDRYREFILNYADLAQQLQAKALILGDPGVTPSLPEISSYPFALTRWQQLLKEIRTRYKGQITWALSAPGNLSSPPSFLIDVDQLYVLVSAPLGEYKGGSDSFIPQIKALFEGDMLSIKNKFNKQLLVGIDYPSASGAETGCINAGDSCAPFSQLDPPYTEDIAATVNLQEQVDIYHAFLSVVNESPWVDGFVSRRYYPPVPLQDKSSSVHGKPAASVLWFWYSKFQSQK
jgi:hypothetical protein